MNFNQYCTDGVALYDDFAQMVADFLEDAIRKGTTLRLQAALHRAKTPASLQKKLERDGALERPDIEEVIKDLAGCRLIFYTNSDVDGFRGSDILHGHFKIDWDRTKIHHPVPLATARPKLFSSHNFVVELGEELATQPELARFKGLRCEVQVQTILKSRLVGDGARHPL
jgi:ppGpp synthetase/RelA/SpoT-type nucleotidyltranferase